MLTLTNMRGLGPGFLVFSVALGMVGCNSKYDTDSIKDPVYADGRIPEPKMEAQEGAYAYTAKEYDQEEYQLPLATLPENFERDIKGKLRLELTEGQKKALLDNGVLVLRHGEYDDFYDAYEKLKKLRTYLHDGQPRYDEGGVPTIITTDSVLHLLHIISNELLQYIEIKALAPTLRSFLDQTLTASVQQYNGLSNDELREAVGRNVILLSVAIKLLEPDTKVPKLAAKAVETELVSISAAKGIERTSFLCTKCPETCDTIVLRGDVPENVNHDGANWAPKDFYREVCRTHCQYQDYSQYTPRGHYTLTPELTRYFKAAMWLSRSSINLGSRQGVQQAVFLADAVKASGATNDWRRLQSAMSFFAGKSSAPLLADLDAFVAAKWGAGFDEQSKLTEGAGSFAKEAVTQFGDGRGQGVVVNDELIADMPGLVVLGQGYPLDAKAFDLLTYSRVGENPASNKRFLPSGLDIMAVLGSQSAEAVLKEAGAFEFEGYEHGLRELQGEVRAFSHRDWTSGLHQGWLWMIQPLLMPKPQGWPNWMRSAAWIDKELVTALGSWAQLRHDTLLLVSQSYANAFLGIEMEPKYYGYVEPNPELYARALYLVDHVNAGFKSLDLASTGSEQAMAKVRAILQRLLDISEKELQGTPLAEEDYDYIKDIDEAFNNALEELIAAVSLNPVDDPEGRYDHRVLGKDDPFNTAIVADVHTDPNSGNVLQVATGKLDLVLVAHASKEGRIGVAVGPVYSYYEFSHPMNDRMTDQIWRQRLGSKTDQPGRPAWLSYVE